MPKNLETENGKSSYVWVKASNEHAGSQLERLRSQCGSPRDVEARGLAYFDGQGSPVGFVGAIHDLGGRTAELERSNQALRASENLARGQLAALARTLDLLAEECDPDKLPKHVITTILTQMGAHSVTIWERVSEELQLLGIVEGGRFNPRIEDGRFEGSILVSNPLVPLWDEGLQVGSYLIIEDINVDPARVILDDGRTALWPNHSLPPSFAALKQHFIVNGVRALMIAPMTMAGRLAGIIGIRFTGTRMFGREEIDLTKALAHQAMLAMQLMRLSQQSRDAAIAAERNRVAHDLHDTLAQGFTGVIMQLEAARGAAAHANVTEAASRIDSASELARAGLADARRSVHALHPSLLDNQGLARAIDDLLKRMSEGTPLRAHFVSAGDDCTIPAAYAESLLRIAQETLANAMRHAHAKNFRVHLQSNTGSVRLDLSDDGRGFDPREQGNSFGLHGMRERTERMGGVFSLRSHPGSGTEISVAFEYRPA